MIIPLHHILQRERNRTLVLGRRLLGPDEAERWLKDFDAAQPPRQQPPVDDGGPMAGGWFHICYGSKWSPQEMGFQWVPGSKASIFFGINRKTGANSVAPVVLQFDPYIPK